MKIKKMKFAGLLIAITMIIVILGVFSITVRAANGVPIASGTCGDNLTWEITVNEDGTTHTLTINGSGDMEIDDPVNVPWFIYRQSINKINLPQRLTSISDYAFTECNKLTDITIPDSVTTIGRHAFTLCDSLVNVVLPKNLSAIEYGLFSNSRSLTSITIPASVKSINYSAFENCHNLTNLVMLGDVPEVSNSMFIGNSFTAVFVPSEYYNNYLATWSWFYNIIFAVGDNDSYLSYIEGVEEFYSYNDSKKICPKDFIVKDDKGRVLTEGEHYTVNYGYNDIIEYIGTVTATAIPGSGYVGSITATFNIIEHFHNWTFTVNGNTITATCTGGLSRCYTPVQTVSVLASDKTYNGIANTATLEGEIEDVTVDEIVYTLETGGTPSKAPVKAGEYIASIIAGGKTASVRFAIDKKPVTATVIAQNKLYDGNTETKVVAIIDDDQLIAGDSITIVGIKGNFSDANVGMGKTVTINTSEVTLEGVNFDCYEIIYPTTTTATISKSTTPEIVWPTANVITYGQKLSDSTLISTDENGTFTWQNGDTVPNVTNDGFVVVYNPKYNYDYLGVELTKRIPVTVSPKEVTVTVDDIEIYVGGSYTLTYTLFGLVDNDTLTAIPTLNTDANVNTAGEYPITVSGVTVGENYTLTFKNGTLTVRDHEYNGVVTVEPTCMAVGEMTYTCVHDSSHTYTEQIVVDENAHEWNDGVVTTEPTCVEKGVKTYTCTLNSAHTKTEDVNARGHNYDNACDGECNACADERTPAEHYSQNADGKCDECGENFELSGGAIAGIVIGSVVVVGGGGFVLWWFVFRKKRII